MLLLLLLAALEQGLCVGLRSLKWPMERSSKVFVSALVCGLVVMWCGVKLEAPTDLKCEVQPGAASPAGYLS